MDSFAAIYLDTQVLVQADWPTESVELRTFLYLARMLSVAVVIPEPVEMERERQCIAALEKHSKTLTDARLRFRRWRIPIELPLLDTLNESLFTNHYRSTANDLKHRWDISTAPITKTSLDEIFRMAIARGGAFEESGKGVVGFQDTVVILAVVEHLRSLNSHVGGFVSQDGVFERKPEVTALAVEAGVTLRFFKTLAEVIATWKKKLGSDPHRDWDVDVHLADEALQRVKSLLLSFALEELNRAALEGAEPVNVELRNARILDITNVQTPPLEKRKLGEPRQISFDVSFEADQVVTIPQYRPAILGLPVWSLESALQSYSIKSSYHIKIEASAVWQGDEYTEIKPDRIVAGYCNRVY
jgi:hypothetical protein